MFVARIDKLNAQRHVMRRIDSAFLSVDAMVRAESRLRA